MSELLPKGEKLRRAVRWISEQREQAPAPPRAALLDEATRRFDLSPREAELLADFVRQGEAAAARDRS
jgi:hypothetical protein